MTEADKDFDKFMANPNIDQDTKNVISWLWDRTMDVEENDY